MANSNQQRVASLLREACSLLGDSTASSSTTDSVANTGATSSSSNVPIYRAATGTATASSNVYGRSAVRQIFQPYRNSGPGRRRIQSNYSNNPNEEATTWTHKFFCLARNDQVKANNQILKPLFKGITLYI
jgi:hypothetical protein